MEGEWSCYRGGKFNGESKIMLDGQYNGGRMVMLQRWSLMDGRMVILQKWLLMEGEWS